MTAPPRSIVVKCPECGHIYQDWYRSSINLTLEPFDEEYLEQATTSTCPKCGYKVRHEVLIVRDDGVWEIGPTKEHRGKGWHSNTEKNRNGTGSESGSPSNWVAGVDGCRTGWVVVLENQQTRDITCRCVGSFSEILRLPERPHVISIDIPIGLLTAATRGGRQCDRDARKLLGYPRASSVFSPPVRAALSAESYEQAAKRNRSSSPERIGISRQSFGILKKIAQVDKEMSRRRQERVREVHPEVSFYEMNDRQPVIPPKRSGEGFQYRLHLLERVAFHRSLEGILAEARQCGIEKEDLIDACAACWTARRISCGEAIGIPSQTIRDDNGLSMKIWR
jgi:predicted RNase H-like nuclease